MDLERIEELLKLLSDHDVSEFSFKDKEQTLRLRLGPPPAVATVAAPAPSVGLPAPAAAAAPAPEVASPAATVPAADASLKVVESPMVGTYYSAPAPDADAFVKVGDVVKKGQTLCIVEAMKLMNEIEAEFGGTVVEMCVENAQPVQFGQALFRIRP